MFPVCANREIVSTLFPRLQGPLCYTIFIQLVSQQKFDKLHEKKWLGVIYCATGARVGAQEHKHRKNLI